MTRAIVLSAVGAVLLVLAVELLSNRLNAGVWFCGGPAADDPCEAPR